MNASRAAKSSRTILVIGQWRSPEFGDALRLMRERAAVHCVDTTAAAIHELSRGESPYLVVLAQTRRGQFQDQDLQSLAHASPLSRFVALLGPWCEGEPRTGYPLSGVPRVYWHQWTLRFPSEWAASPVNSQWAQPRTLTRVDAALFDHEPEPNGRRLSVVVAAANRADYECLRDTLKLHGAASQWCKTKSLNTTDWTEFQPSQLWIWDAPVWDAIETRRFESAMQAVRPECLLLLGWPRLTDVEQAKRLGAAEVASKPYMAADLGCWIRSRAIRAAA